MWMMPTYTYHGSACPTRAARLTDEQLLAYLRTHASHPTSAEQCRAIVRQATSIGAQRIPLWGCANPCPHAGCQGFSPDTGCPGYTTKEPW